MTDVAADRLASAIDELYGLDPDDFTAARTRLATEAKAAGDRATATAITALRRPTRSAALVNRLVRADSSVVDELSALGTDLAQAQRALDGARLRELSGRRRRLIEELTRRALDISSDAPTAAVREEVGATLEAALADPGLAERLSLGTLLKAASWAGFGTPPPDLQIVATPTAGRTSKAYAGRTAATKSAKTSAGGAAPDPKLTASKATAEERARQLARERAEERAAADRAKAERARQEAIERAEADVVEAQHDVERAKAAHADAKRELQRVEEVVTQARRRLDDTAADVRAATTRHAQAAQAARAARR